MKSTDAVQVTTVVAVDPMTAFSVFTGEIGIWWKPKVGNLFHRGRAGLLKFEPGPEGRLIEVYEDVPGRPTVVGRILAWEPGVRLAFQWHQEDFTPGQTTEVEVRFEGVEAGTRVTLEHRGWDILPLEHPARHGCSGTAFAGMIGLRWADPLIAFGALAKGRM